MADLAHERFLPVATRSREAFFKVKSDPNFVRMTLYTVEASKRARQEWEIVYAFDRETGYRWVEHSLRNIHVLRACRIGQAVETALSNPFVDKARGQFCRRYALR
jgi:hypothetical protein